MTHTTLSRHAQQRTGDRGISRVMIDAALAFGQKQRSDGSLYYIMTRRAVRDMLRVFQPDNPDRYRGLVVVCSPDKRTVITCFKNDNWTRKIRHKR
ncbi:MAG: DUF4258 domain-containing protein [Calditrichaeota bacterium]|nr:MAG: DUF4258 domain-containing protein [Calditrichota bacterium]